MRDAILVASVIIRLSGHPRREWNRRSQRRLPSAFLPLIRGADPSAARHECPDGGDLCLSIIIIIIIIVIIIIIITIIIIIIPTNNFLGGKKKSSKKKSKKLEKKLG